jgi:alkylated DNA repair dioxygenase AlkB
MNKRKGDQTITMDAGETKRLQCISPSKKEDSEEDAVLNKKKLIWDDNWLEFKETPALEEIKIDNHSTLKWCPNFISKKESDALFDHLMEELKFEHTAISMYGKPVNLPRLQSWFAEEGLVVKELFQKQKQHVWTLPMRKLKAQLEKQLGVEFDYCLVNLYRNGNDYINFHADNETKDIIASITLGATRRFLLRHLSCFGRTLTRKRKALTTPDTKEYKFSLTNGSLIVMLDDTQQYWKHSVPKEKKVKDPRINLTFRVMRDK